MAGAEHNLQPDEASPGSLPSSLPAHDDPRPEGWESAEPTWAAADPLLRIRSANQAGHWTLELEGELDVSNAAVLASELHRVEPHADDLTIDLRELAFIDSRGVLAILDAHRRRLRDGRDGRLHLRKGTRELQPIFRVSGLEKLLPFDG